MTDVRYQGGRVLAGVFLVTLMFSCNYRCQDLVIPDRRLALWILPYPPGRSFELFLGYCSPSGHTNRIAYDFRMPFGEAITCARPGRVIEIFDSYRDDDNLAGHNNRVLIQHCDGSIAWYAHLQYFSVDLAVGDSEEYGERIGLCGTSGRSGKVPHLHFEVFRENKYDYSDAIPVSFRNLKGQLDNRGALVPGRYYEALGYRAVELENSISGGEIATQVPPYYRLNLEPPGVDPAVFAPGVVSTWHHEHSAPAISPDGTEIYWSVWEKPAPPDPIQQIWFIKFHKSGWSNPETAPFSGVYSDGGPFFSADGEKIFFYSLRPLEREEPAADNNNIWYVRRDESGWTEPESIGPEINNERLQAMPALSRNGSLYFLNHLENVENGYGIFRSIPEDGEYSEPEVLPRQVNSTYREWCPYVAPDEDYVIFSSHRPGGYGSGDLYICFQYEDGKWSEAINLGKKVNSASQERFPMISPDGKVFFFGRATTEAYGDIFWMKADFIEELEEEFSSRAR